MLEIVEQTDSILRVFNMFTCSGRRDLSRLPGRVIRRYVLLRDTFLQRLFEGFSVSSTRPSRYGGLKRAFAKGVHWLFAA